MNPNEMIDAYDLDLGAAQFRDERGRLWRVVEVTPDGAVLAQLDFPPPTDLVDELVRRGRWRRRP